MFKESIDWYTSRESDQDTLSAAFTYGIWADLEANHGNSAESLRLMRLAVDQYSIVARYDVAKAQIGILNSKIKLLTDNAGDN